MAKMLKKLQQKITPPEKPKPRRPPGKDYMLLIMYILLTLSLLLTYTRRQAADRLSEFQMMIVTRASFVTIGMAGALFLFDAYRRFMA